MNGTFPEFFFRDPVSYVWGYLRKIWMEVHEAMKFSRIPTNPGQFSDRRCRVYAGTTVHLRRKKVPEITGSRNKYLMNPHRSKKNKIKIARIDRSFDQRDRILWSPRGKTNGKCERFDRFRRNEGGENCAYPGSSSPVKSSH